MSSAGDSTVSVLTPPGAGAIAVVAVSGSRAWETIRRHFRPATGTLPEVPLLQRFWFGTFGRDGHPGDEVILSVKPDSFEIHCHGGVRVVRWIVDLFLEQGFVERPAVLSSSLWDLVSRAPTSRTASILLDQSRGAFRQSLQRILAGWPGTAGELERLASLAPLGRHLVDPWRVVIAGPPNVGKSSLLNALAGYTRSIVAPVKGTTRDVVTASLAFDGWPVELSDTAGLHESSDVLESAGIAMAEEQLQRADLVLWVMDATDESPRLPDPLPGAETIYILNKCDLVMPRLGLPVSAHTRQGVPELMTIIVSHLVPFAPQPLEAVPYSKTLAEAVERAFRDWQSGNLDAARATLTACLAECEG